VCNVCGKSIILAHELADKVENGLTSAPGRPSSFFNMFVLQNYAVES